MLPPSFDLTANCSPVRDQGQMGSCTAFASTAMLEFLYRKYKGMTPVFSPLFQYYQERVMDGDFSQGDTGSTGRTAVKCLNQFGCCLESDEPYDDSGAGITEVPTAQDITDAVSYQAGAYHAITNVQDMKSCIASSYCFIVGFNVFDSFEADTTASSGLMPVPEYRNRVPAGRSRGLLRRLRRHRDVSGGYAGGVQGKEQLGHELGASRLLLVPLSMRRRPKRAHGRLHISFWQAVVAAGLLVVILIALAAPAWPRRPKS